MGNTKLIQWTVLGSCLFAVPLFGQAEKSLQYGVKLGVQLTDSFDSTVGFNADRTRFVIGPEVSYDITNRFGGIGVEADLLFRRYHFNELRLGDPLNPAIPLLASTHGTMIDIPLLAKWSPVGKRYLNPYVLAGLSIRHTGGTQDRQFFLGQDRNDSISSPAIQNSWTAGFTLGGGLRLGPWNRVHIEPEVRYTHWGGPAIQATSTFSGTSTMQNQQNIAELLFGVTF
jgi:opacity protein-like surface antigen